MMNANQGGTISHRQPRNPPAHPVESNPGLSWPAPLSGRLASGATVEQVADAIVAVWVEIDLALNPIIGHRGFAALYNRSLKLTAARYSWLATEHAGPLAAIDTTALRAALLQQTAAEATAAGIAHFASFHGVLASLVGSSLGARLLHPVWDHSSRASPAQDTTS